jgi:hypothetical protein
VIQGEAKWGQGVEMDVRVTSDPADIGHARELVVGVNVKGVFDSHSSAKEVAAGRVYDTLGFAGRAGGL